MKGYICNDCGAPFTTPIIVGGGFQHGWGFRREYEEQCPYCNSDDFDDAETCPNCNISLMRVGDNLCPGCHAELFRKFRAFADELTAEEEKDLDDLLDGRSVTERNGWK